MPTVGKKKYSYTARVKQQQRNKLKKQVKK